MHSKVSHHSSTTTCSSSGSRSHSSQSPNPTAASVRGWHGSGSDHRPCRHSHCQPGTSVDGRHASRGSRNITSMGGGRIRTTAKERMSDYLERTRGVVASDLQQRDRIISALAARAYHLPGNGCCADWIQFLANNHPIFGICCHHSLNPVGYRMRVVNLVGSIVVGLAITNIIWLFMMNEGDKVLVTVTVGDMTENATLTDDIGGNSTAPYSVFQLRETRQIVLTKGMLVLWSIGSGFHSLFDNTIWYMTACVCCLPGQSLQCLGRFRCCGTYLVVMVVIFFTAVATLAVILRATIDNDDDDNHIDLSNSQNRTGLQPSVLVDGALGLRLSAFDFVLSYAIELALALFLYYPVIATVLFSGCLGCGKLPILGGRPYEVAQEQKQLSKHRNSMALGRDEERNFT